MQYSTEKEGWIRKRGSRMYRWTMRYFLLAGPKLVYKIKPDQSTVRGAFDLVPGCMVTEVTEDSRGVIKGKKLYVFWIVWPHDKNSKTDTEKDDRTDDDSDVEEIEAKDDANLVTKPKNLKEIVKSEVMTQREEKRLAEEQLEKHQAHDSTVSAGMKVAAVAVGGVVVGALTAGIGLVPYITIVGLTAVAGASGVAYSYKKPADSRLILACESMAEALVWKTAIESQISKIEILRKPTLPLSADPCAISQILGSGAHTSSTWGHGWKMVRLVEGMRILEYSAPPMAGCRCRRAQTVINSTPLAAFLAMMEVSGATWPGVDCGSLKQVHIVDDHTDILGLTVISRPASPSPSLPFIPSLLPATAPPATWQTALSRFWRMDDDGNYLIAFNSVRHQEFPLEEGPGRAELGMMMVVTISPRKDHGEFDDDLQEVKRDDQSSGGVGKGRWPPEALDAFMDRAVLQILELKHAVLLNRYAYQDRQVIREREREKERERAEKEEKEAAKKNDSRSFRLLPGGGGGGSSASRSDELDIKTDSRDKGGGLAARTSIFRRSSGKQLINDIPSSPPVSVVTVQPGAESDYASPRNATQMDGKRWLRGGDSSEHLAVHRSRSMSPLPTHSSSAAAAAAANGSSAATAALTHSKNVTFFDDKTMHGATETGSTNKKKLRYWSRNRGASRARGASVNAEAAGLRARIAAKDFEVQRIEKLIRKRGAGSGGVGTASIRGGGIMAPGGGGAMDLLGPMQMLLRDLSDLKTQYFSLTGQQYEAQSRFRKTLFGKSKKPLLPSSSSTDASGQLVDDATAFRSRSSSDVEGPGSSTGGQGGGGGDVEILMTSPLHWQNPQNIKMRAIAKAECESGSGGVWSSCWSLVLHGASLQERRALVVFLLLGSFGLGFVLSLAIANLVVDYLPVIIN